MRVESSDQPKEKLPEERFLVGTITGAHGLSGLLKIRPASNNPSLILNIKDVFLSSPTMQPLTCQVEEIFLDKKSIMLKLKQIADRTEAEHLIGYQVETLRSQLQNLAEDEWWAKDLIGLPVYTTDGALIGTVYDIVGEQGQLLEIESSSRTGENKILVPFVKALVPVVDIASKRIEVVNMPGLLD